MPELPASVQQIAEVIGQDAALQLVRRWPRKARTADGTARPVIYVPAKVPPSHPLAEILGVEAALKLSAAYGGEILFLATCANEANDCRRAAILRLACAGWGTEAIALVTGVTPRRVRQVIAEVRAEVMPATRGDDSAKPCGSVCND